MSLRTTAAARQNEMNVNATVVATTTFAELPFPEMSGVCICLLDDDEAASIGVQQARQSGFPGPMTTIDCGPTASKGFIRVPAEQDAHGGVCFETDEQAGHHAFEEINRDRRLIEGQRIGNDLRS